MGQCLIFRDQQMMRGWLAGGPIVMIDRAPRSPRPQWNALSPLMSRIGGGLIVKVCQAGLAFLVMIFLTRSIGAEVFGEFAFGVATAALVAVFSRYGFHVYIVYAVNRALAQGAGTELRRILIISGSFVAILSSAAALMLHMLAGAVPGWSMSVPTQAAAWLIAPVAIVQVAGGALQALDRVVLGQALEGIGRPLVFCLYVAIAWGWGVGLDVQTLLLAFGLAEVTLIVIAAGLIAGRLHAVTLRNLPSRPIQHNVWRYHIRAATPFVLANGMVQLYMLAGLIAVGIWMSASDVAVYRVASQVAGLIAFGLQALQAALQPSIAHASATPQALSTVQRQLTLGTRGLSLALSPVVVLCFFWPDWLLSLFDASFENHGAVLRILAIGQTVSLLSGVNGAILNMNGLAWITARWSGMAFGVQCVLIALLLPSFGILGIAMADALSRVIWNLALVRAASVRTGLYSSVFGVGFLPPSRQAVS
jgi:O-antigen/teichoic acid export membrane protein